MVQQAQKGKHRGGEPPEEKERSADTSVADGSQSRGGGSVSAQWMQLIFVVVITSVVQAYLYSYVQPQLNLPSLMTLNSLWDAGVDNSGGGDGSSEAGSLASHPARAGAGAGLAGAPKLLLIMLVRNEEANLAHVLPLWSSNIDFWVIGVDSNTTDSSVPTIMEKLAKVPGRVVPVTFGSSFGALWTYLAAKGNDLYPEATHSILTHSDYVPVHPPFSEGGGGGGRGAGGRPPAPGGFGGPLSAPLLDRRELRMECSQQRINIWMHERVYLRRPFVIFRNLPGVVLPYRMSEVVEGPPMRRAGDGGGGGGRRRESDPPHCAAPVAFHVEEIKTGFLYRLPGALGVLQEMVDTDLQQRPDDPHAVYLVGYVLYDTFLHAASAPTEADWKALWKGMEHLERRSLRMSRKGRGLAGGAGAGGGLEGGGGGGGGGGEDEDEEEWMATIKLAEIYERFLADMGAAEQAYTHATRLAPHRADGWFYLGQRQRLNGNCREAIPFLQKAAELPMPATTGSEWVYLYRCLVHLELARAITCADGGGGEGDSEGEGEGGEDGGPGDREGAGRGHPDPGEMLRLVRHSIRAARRQCPARHLSGEMNLLMEMAEDIGAPAPGPGMEAWPAAPEAVRYALEEFLAQLAAWDPRLEEALSHRIFERQGTGGGPRGFFALDLYTPLGGHVRAMRALLARPAGSPPPTCRDYRLATRPYLFFFQEAEADIVRLLKDEGRGEESLVDVWLMYNARIRSVCRSLTPRGRKGAEDGA